MTNWTDMCQDLAAEVERLKSQIERADARIQELLEANNREVGLRRRAEHALDQLQFDRIDQLDERRSVLHDPIENLDAIAVSMEVDGASGILTVREIAAQLERCKEIMKGPPV